MEAFYRDCQLGSSPWCKRDGCGLGAIAHIYTPEPSHLSGYAGASANDERDAV
jgi:hypothetical protein